MYLCSPVCAPKYQPAHSLYEMVILRTGDRDIVSLPAVQEVWRGASDAVQQSLVKNARAITPARSRVKSRLRQGELLPLLTLLQAGEETNGYGYIS